MLTYEATSSADPRVAWAVYAQPARWPEWAPQLRGAWGLGDPEVRRGARGAARLLGAIPVPAVIEDVRAPERWVWRVGPVRFVHRVEPRPEGGCVVAVDLIAAPPLEAVLRVSYGPVCGIFMRRLARAAERG